MLLPNAIRKCYSRMLLPNAIAERYSQMLCTQQKQSAKIFLLLAPPYKHTQPLHLCCLGNFEWNCEPFSLLFVSNDVAIFTFNLRSSAEFRVSSPSSLICRLARCSGRTRTDRVAASGPLKSLLVIRANLKCSILDSSPSEWNVNGCSPTEELFKVFITVSLHCLKTV